jgi:large subunit ribosomal protein L6
MCDTLRNTLRRGRCAVPTIRFRKPDPYKQKGVRYTGEVLKKKAGKTGAK